MSLQCQYRSPHQLRIQDGPECGNNLPISITWNKLGHCRRLGSSPKCAIFTVQMPTKVPLQLKTSHVSQQVFDGIARLQVWLEFFPGLMTMTILGCSYQQLLTLLVGPQTNVTRTSVLPRQIVPGHWTCIPEHVSTKRNKHPRLQLRWCSGFDKKHSSKAGGSFRIIQQQQQAIK